jgi:hypothetical protein
MYHINVGNIRARLYSGFARLALVTGGSDGKRRKAFRQNVEGRENVGHVDLYGPRPRAIRCVAERADQPAGNSRLIRIPVAALRELAQQSNKRH